VQTGTLEMTYNRKNIRSQETKQNENRDNYTKRSRALCSECVVGVVKSAESQLL